MKLTEKKQRWVPHDEVLPQSGGGGGSPPLPDS